MKQMTTSENCFIENSLPCGSVGKIEHWQLEILSEDLRFPSPTNADEEGLLAIGGDLSPERLVMAYSMGIFPWYSAGDPIMWWSPDPRMVHRG